MSLTSQWHKPIREIYPALNEVQCRTVRDLLVRRFPSQAKVFFDTQIASVAPGREFRDFLHNWTESPETQKFLEALYDLANKENCDSVFELFTFHIGLHSDFLRNEHTFATTPGTLHEGGMGKMIINDWMDTEKNELSYLSQQLHLFPGLETDFALHIDERSRARERKPKLYDFH